MTTDELLIRLQTNNPDFAFNKINRNKRTFFQITHLICGNSFEKRTDRIKSSAYICPICKKESIFLEKLSKKRPSVKMLGKYTSYKNETLFHCNIHNTDWYATPQHELYYSSGCKLCYYSNTLKTQEKFEEDIYKKNSNIKILGKYKGTHKKISMQCLICEHIWEAEPNSVLSGTGCPKCGCVKLGLSLRKSHEQFVREMSYINPNIDILTKYNKQNEYIRCKCKICDNEWNALGGNLLYGKGCPYCAGRKFAPCKKENSVAFLHPYLTKYFKNEEDAWIHTPTSGMFVDFICPDCGKIRKLKISYIIKFGYKCLYCGDGISYPNKFSRSFLEQLPVENVSYEYSPKWIGHKAYDNYFEYNGYKYILEMDGAFHYIREIHKGQLDERKEIDNFKDKEAIKHGIKVIRIKALKSERDYLKQQILESELSNIFDLSHVDWNYCAENALNNSIKVTCDFYNNNKDTMKLTKIAKILKISPSILSYRLKQGKELGWCDYIPRKNKQTYYPIAN